MSILVDADTRVLVQGITGTEGSFHTLQMVRYGTAVVGGVTPGRGGEKVGGIPVFDTVAEAVDVTAANTSVVFVPPAAAADAVEEAAEAGIKTIVCITEGIPTKDMVKAKAYIQSCDARLVGPNCPGVISPGKSKVGIMAGEIHLPGRIAVISRSGTLTYEAVSQLTALGLGQSTCIGIGGDPVTGLDFVDCLSMLQADSETEAVVLIGEIGGDAEERAAGYIKEHFTKPVAAFIAGQTAPPGRRMGHAGAIITGGSGTADSKLQALQRAGTVIITNPGEIGSTTLSMVNQGGTGNAKPGTATGTRQVQFY